MIVLCHGVFDLLHIGHVVHLQEAKEMGSFLIVSVVADRFVSKSKGRPIYNQDSRMKMLAALKSVDRVILCEAPGPEDVITTERPDLYVRGPDYIDKRMPEADILDRLCIPTAYTPSSFKRTTAIIQQIVEACHG